MKKIYIILLAFFGVNPFLFIHAFAQTPVKKVLLEEFTTASCGNCPPMSAYISAWQTSQAANCILMSIHEGSGVDAMSNNLTSVIFNAMHPTGSWFAPAIMINRGVYPSTNGEAYLSNFNSWGSGTGVGIDTIATRLISEPALVGLDITGTYNALTRTINATVNANFVSQVSSGDWRINLFLVEDSVVGYPNLGPFQGWDQECYDVNWANTHYPGMFNGTFIIGYPHRHVMRSSFFGNWGVAGIIPAVPVIGTNYSATASLVVDTAFKDYHLSIVAFVSHYGSLKSEKYVLNANSIEVTNNFATGITELQNDNHLSFDNIYPQPATGKAQLVYSLNKSSNIVIKIMDVTGKTVKRLLSENISKGKHELIFNTSDLSNGMYFVLLQSGSHLITKKLVVE
ncbi:MAG: T9SS type A sorting domain-containing protein [Bacteroidia bacterium]